MSVILAGNQAWDLGGEKKVGIDRQIGLARAHDSGAGEIAFDGGLGIAGHTQRNQAFEQGARDRQRAGVSRVASDLALAPAVVAEVELDVEARAGHGSRGPVQGEGLATLDGDRRIRHHQRSNALGRDAESGVDGAATGSQRDGPAGRAGRHGQGFGARVTDACLSRFTGGDPGDRKRIGPAGGVQSGYGDGAHVVRHRWRSAHVGVHANVARGARVAVGSARHVQRAVTLGILLVPDHELSLGAVVHEATHIRVGRIACRARDIVNLEQAMGARPDRHRRAAGTTRASTTTRAGGTARAIARAARTASGKHEGDGDGKGHQTKG